MQAQDTWLELNMQHQTFTGEMENRSGFFAVSGFGLVQGQILQLLEVFWYIDPCDIFVFISDTEGKGNKKNFQSHSTLSLN